jgi:hypothetical protein
LLSFLGLRLTDISGTRKAVIEIVGLTEVGLQLTDEQRGRYTGQANRVTSVMGHRSNRHVDEVRLNG